MSNWQNLEIEKIADFNPRESLSKGSLARKIPMDCLRVFEKKIIGFEFAKYSGGPKFRNGDTLLAKITPCLENGKTAKVDILNDDEVAFGSSEFIVLRAKENNDSDYLYYLARSPAFRKKAISCMEGTSGRKRVNEGALKLQILPIPNPDIQQKITSVLSALDAKIEFNNQINVELEKMAKTLYDYWFVQFDFPDANGKPYKSSGGKMIWNEELKREIPDGWEVKEVKDFLNVATGKEDANFAEINGKYPFFTCGEEVLKCNKAKFKGKAVLVAGNGNFNVKYFDGEFNAYQRTYVLIPSEVKYVGIVFRNVFENISKFKISSNGSIVKFIRKEDVEKIKVILPKDNFKILEILNQNIDFIQKNIQQNQTLAELRDWLLPMLMNGQVKVN